jgi:hypothetical protein
MEASTISTVVEPRSIRARRMITEVTAALAAETPAQISSRFSDYQKEFPRIFAMLLTRTYPEAVLEMMLRQLESVEDGRTSQHNASVHVGTVLVDQFVKPQLSGSPPAKRGEK